MEKSENGLGFPVRFHFQESNLVRAMIAMTVLLAACAKNTSEEWTSIPTLTVICQSARCKQNMSIDFAAELNANGCSNYNTDAERTTAPISVNCSAISGCVASIYGWRYKDLRPTTGIPKGTYSLCVQLDMNMDGIISVGDTIGAVNGIVIDGNSTQKVTYGTYTDL